MRLSLSEAKANSLLTKLKQIKTIKLFFAVAAATVFLGACNNTGNNQQQDADTMEMTPTPMPSDTMMNDTMNDTLMNDTL